MEHRLMTTITIDLPDDVLARLSQHAQTFKTSVTELAEAFVERGIEDEDQAEQSWDPSLTLEDIAAIERGLADIAAGRTVPDAQVMEEMRKLIAV
jgi:predicted transcriptional regulator